MWQREWSGEIGNNLFINRPVRVGQVVKGVPRWVDGRRMG